MRLSWFLPALLLFSGCVADIGYTRPLGTTYEVHALCPDRSGALMTLNEKHGVDHVLRVVSHFHGGPSLPSLAYPILTTREKAESLFKTQPGYTVEVTAKVHGRSMSFVHQRLEIESGTDESAGLFATRAEVFLSDLDAESPSWHLESHLAHGRISPVIRFFSAVGIRSVLAGFWRESGRRGWLVERKMNLDDIAGKWNLIRFEAEIDSGSFMCETDDNGRTVLWVETKDQEQFLRLAHLWTRIGHSPPSWRR